MSDETRSGSTKSGREGSPPWGRLARLWREPSSRETADAGKRTVPPDQLVALFPPDPGAIRRVAVDPFLDATALPDTLVSREDSPPAELALVTVCTANHLHFARTLVRSFRAHHPDTSAWVVVADAEPGEAFEVAGARTIAGREIAPRDLPYLALKLDACNLCCALKPFALQAVSRLSGAARMLYLDADILVCARFDAMLELLSQHDFVLTPHLLAPYEFRDRVWQRPSMGDIAAAGFFNGGIIGLRAGEATERFLATWREMVSTPGAFDPRLGPQHEQNSLNFVTSFAEGVAVLRDPAYNVAYWNLHERGVRWHGLDGGDSVRWSVDGEPLICFHFSGFRPSDPTRLSHHDSRHGIYHLPSVAALAAHYCEELERSGASRIAPKPYRYSRLPSGVPLDSRLRRVFVEHERDIRCDLDPWSDAGEAVYCRAALSPVPHATGLLPAFVAQLLRDRPDLQQSHPHARARPLGLMRWFYQHGVVESGASQLVDRHRPAVLSVAGSDSLAGVKVYIPAAFEGLDRPLGADRSELLRRLATGGHSQLVEDITGGIVEHWRLSTLQVVRAIVEERPDLRDTFPDLLDRDAPAFANWLAEEAVDLYGLPAETPDVFLRCSRGRSLARIFVFLARHPFLQAGFPLALVGVDREAFCETLLGALWSGVEFDLEDLVAYLWTMDEQPWTGLPLLFELPEHARKRPSPLLPEGQDALLPATLLGHPLFRAALAAYRELGDAEDRQRLQVYLRRFEGSVQQPPGSIYRHVSWVGAGPAGAGAAEESDRARRALAEAGITLAAGVNLFGYHRSAIGLGSMTRGLSRALAMAGLPVAHSILGSVGMDSDVEMDDLVGSYNHGFDCNLFVSYPHLEEDLMARLPAHARAARRNIVYLAWEQRDGHPWWHRIYAGYDQVWALSEFAARHLSDHLRREVVAMPCALDFSEFPAPARKEQVGLDPGDFVFLYTFDAASSIERKNPEAVIRAFRTAFPRAARVRLLLRISNADRLETRDRLRRVVDAAAGDPRVEFRFDRLTRRASLEVVSAVDAVVSLHRAEGFGYLCAEAMAYARPVVATRYSGNLQFMNDDNSLLVPAREVEVATAEGPFQLGSVWAEPDLVAAVDAMRRLFEEPELRSAIGERGRRAVREMLSVEAAARRVAAALGQPLPEVAVAPPPPRRLVTT